MDRGPSRKKAKKRIDRQKKVQKEKRKLIIQQSASLDSLVNGNQQSSSLLDGVADGCDRITRQSVNGGPITLLSASQLNGQPSSSVVQGPASHLNGGGSEAEFQIEVLALGSEVEHGEAEGAAVKKEKEDQKMMMYLNLDASPMAPLSVSLVNGDGDGDLNGGSLVSPSTTEVVIPASVEYRGGDQRMELATNKEGPCVVEEQKKEDDGEGEAKCTLNDIVEIASDEGNAREEDEGEDYDEDEEEEEEKDYGYLCTIFSDFLCGLASAPDRVRYDPMLIRSKAIFGFRQCYEDGDWTSCQLGTDTMGIDIRGFYLPIALHVLKMHLYCWSCHPDMRRLLVTVGCMKHGCGEGKLKQTVIDRLKRDETIEFELLDFDGATISITLNRIDYTSIGWPPFLEREPEEENMKALDPGVESEKTTEVEEVIIDEDYGYLCTNVCDFLADLDLTEPGLVGDTQISLKVLSGFRKCEKDETCELDDDTLGIDIRGLSFSEALEMVMTNLFCWSRQHDVKDQPDVKKLLVKVGCKVHGCGEGILKKKVTEVLERDKKISFEYLDNGTTISILLDGGSDYKDTNWYLVNVKEESILVDKEWEEAFQKMRERNRGTT